MSFPRRVPKGRDEELGKKFDDHHPAKNEAFNLLTWLRLLPRRPRRIAFVVLGLVLLVLFVQNILPTDGPPASEGMNRFPEPPGGPGQDVVALPPDSPPHPDETVTDPGYHFNGPIKFYSLAKSLSLTKEQELVQKEDNLILFAAADLKCVSDLLPLACEMARTKVNRVHFALMGRGKVSIEGIQRVNGISEPECPLVWHDGRPDHGASSTDGRMESSVKAALGRIVKALHHRVVITHDDGWETQYFWKGIKKRAEQMRVAHLDIPNRASNLKWIAKLDSSSLEAWNKINVDILIHALPRSAGGLIRALKSLEGADYFGETPSLTIELPAESDVLLLKFLSSFTWPPSSGRRDFTLRRRVQSQHLTPEEASLRTVDAIYPKDPNYSNVLVLSPQVELAPSYYHYLKYTLLAYKHSKHSERAPQGLAGISLDLPSSKPTDGEPVFYQLESQSPAGADSIPALLWQVPNNNAALYFGDKWIEFRSFLSNRLSSALNSPRHSNELPTYFPAWMAFMLELIRARGYFMIFPDFADKDKLALVSVHNELFQPPEEFASPPLVPTLDPDVDEEPRPDEPLPVRPGVQDGRPKTVEKELSGSSTISNLLNNFPDGLPAVSSLPVLNYSGEPISPGELVAQTEVYRKTFRTEIGGCREGDKPAEIVPLQADDLFCWAGDEKRE